MIKLRLKYDEKPYPGFLTDSNWEQLAELCQLFGFPPRGLLLFPATLPETAWAPLQASLKEKGLNATPLPFSLAKFPTVRDVAALADTLPADLSKQTVFLLGGGRFLSAADFALSLFRQPVRTVFVPTSLTAQAEFPFWNRAFASSRVRAATFQAKAPSRDLLWLSTDVLFSLPDSNFYLGLLAILRLASLFDRQLFLFLEEKAAQLLKKEPDVLVQALFKTYKIKTDVLLPTQFHALLEEWYTVSLPGLAWGTSRPEEIPTESLWALDFLLRLTLSRSLKESDADDLRRFRVVFSSLGLHKALLPGNFENLLAGLEKLPESEFPDAWVLLRGIGKAGVQSGTDKKTVMQALRQVAEDWR